MIASLWKIITDNEGESKITFIVPSSHLTDVVKLGALLQKRLELDIKEAESEFDIGV